MKNKTLNDWLAVEVMGWALKECANNDKMVWLSREKIEMLYNEWNPLEDLNQCAMFEAKLKEIGLEDVYASMLIKVFQENKKSLGAYIRRVFTIATIPPELRCKAALMAAGGDDESK